MSSIINKAGGEVTVQLISDARNDSFSDYYREYEDLTLSKLKKDINAFYRGGGVREISQFYQRAFAGSRVDYDRPSLEAIGTGEGNQAHGWGLYYALDKDVAEKYREDFERDNYFFDEDKLEVERQKQEKSGNFSKTELLEDLLIHHDESNLGNFSDEVVDWYKKEIRPNVLNKNYRKTQVHEVEIPENPFLLDEQLPFSEQSEFVKEKLQELLHDNIFSEYVEEGQTLDDFVETEITDWELGFTGGNIYDRLSNLLGSDQSASSFLERYGIKGITYDGQQDGRAFVIFNPDDVEVIQKFYQLPQDNLENAVKITGKEFGEYEGNDKAYIAKAKQWYRKNLAGNYATSPVIGEVNFYNRQFSETKDKNIKNIENLKYLPAVYQIIETSTNVQEEKPNHFRGDDVVRFYRITAPVNINGEFNNISVLVAEDRQRRKYYTLENKGLAQDTSVERGLTQAQKGNSFYDINIYVNKENVKKNNSSANFNPKGLYDANKGVIRIFESADFSTLPHELAHYWFDNMWRYVRSGNASEKYRQRWNVIANWLNVKQEQAFLTPGQWEKFARGYEQYLLNGNLPTPIIKGAFDDYDRWLKRVYGDMNRLNVRHIDYKKASR